MLELGPKVEKQQLDNIGHNLKGNSLKVWPKNVKHQMFLYSNCGMYACEW
jgi:hypothetical protein